MMPQKIRLTHKLLAAVLHHAHMRMFPCRIVRLHMGFIVVTPCKELATDMAFMIRILPRGGIAFCLAPGALSIRDLSWAGLSALEVLIRGAFADLVSILGGRVGLVGDRPVRRHRLDIPRRGVEIYLGAGAAEHGSIGHIVILSVLHLDLGRKGFRRGLQGE